MRRRLQDCEQITGYHFKDEHLCWEALQVAGSGVVASGPRDFLKGNHRLAILGDTVLDLVLCGKWYESGQSEGHRIHAPVPDMC